MESEVSDKSFESSHRVCRSTDTRLYEWYMMSQNPSQLISEKPAAAKACQDSKGCKHRELDRKKKKEIKKPNTEQKREELKRKEQRADEKREAKRRRAAADHFSVF